MANGLFDFMQSPLGMGLLTAVASGAATARRGTPWNNVGRGLIGGMAGYKEAMGKEAMRKALQNAYEQTVLKPEVPGTFVKGTPDVVIPADPGIDAYGVGVLGYNPKTNATREYWNDSLDFDTAKFVADQNRDVMSLSRQPDNNIPQGGWPQPKPNTPATTYPYNDLHNIKSRGLNEAGAPVGPLVGSSVEKPTVFGGDLVQGRNIEQQLPMITSNPNRPTVGSTPTPEEIRKMVLAQRGSDPYSETEGTVYHRNVFSSPERVVAGTPDRREGYEAPVYGDPKFSYSKLMENILMDPNHPLQEQAHRWYMEQSKGAEAKPQLVELWNPEKKIVEKKWVYPGHTDGVVVGEGKPDSAGALQLKEESIGGGLWQEYWTDPRDPEKKIPWGKPYAKRASASSVTVSTQDRWRAEDKLRDDSYRDKKPINEMASHINRALMLIEQRKTAKTDEEIATIDAGLQRTLTDVFSTSTRAQSEVASWANLGPVGTRIAGTVNRFFSGAYLPNQVSSYESVLSSLLNDSREALERIDQYYGQRGIAGRRQLDPESSTAPSYLPPPKTDNLPKKAPTEKDLDKIFKR